MAGATSNPSSANTGAGAAVDYGLDFPQMTRAMFSRGAWILAFAALIYGINRVEYPGPATRLAVVIMLIAVVCFVLGWWRLRSSRQGKLQVRDQMLDLAGLEGSEKILDVGCGLGLLTIGAAQRLKTGRVIGIDTWLENPKQDTRLSGNSTEAARENAKAAGVAEKLRFENGDLLKLTYPDGHFDVVLSFLALHTFMDPQDRTKALQEMYRVLKPGGKLVIHDIGPVSEYPAVLQAFGATNVAQSATTYLWATAGATVSAKK